MKIALTGGTGFIGAALVSALSTHHHSVTVFTRNPRKAEILFPQAHFPQVTITPYEPTQPGDWQRELGQADAIINLAGEPIAEKKWTPEQKQLILDSRITTTRLISDAIAAAEPRPQVLINASAIGFYGPSDEVTFDETSPSGNDFLAQVCQQWEQAASQVQAHNVRLVILRLGIVLEENGGALGKMLPVFKTFMGGPLGTGKQWFSWIHRQDVINLILQALEEPTMAGVYNATAPEPVTMNELCSVLGAVMKKPSWLPVPGFALNLLLGEGATVVLDGQKVLPQAAQAQGFKFQFSTLKAAIADIVQN